MKAFVDGEGSRQDAITRIAGNYLKMIDVYREAEASS